MRPSSRAPGRRGIERRRGRRLLGGVLLGALLGAAGCGRHAPPGARANLVILSIDALSASALRGFSDDAERLPNLDRFASESVRCANAYTAAPWTLPAHASLLTGLYPDRHGATDSRLRIGSPEATLAETLRGAGFETVAFTGGGFLHWRFGFARGFEIYDDTEDSIVSKIPLLRRYLGPLRFGNDGACGRAVTLLSHRGSDRRPLFLFLHTYFVHDYFKQAESGRTERARQCLQGERTCDAAEWERLHALYRGRLRTLDGDFGGLLARLDALAAQAPTYVIVLSDHGEGFDFARGRIHHGGRLYQDLVRVPLMIRGPGLTPRVVTTPISLVDILPTSLELVGLPSDGELDGRSVVEALRGAELPRRPLFAMDHFHSWGASGRRSATTPQARPLSIAVIDAGGWYIREGDAEELYDMRADPEQRVPLPLEAGPALRKAAQERLLLRAPTSTAAVDDALKEQLRSLGYVN